MLFEKNKHKIWKIKKQNGPDPKKCTWWLTLINSIYIYTPEYIYYNNSPCSRSPRWSSGNPRMLLVLVREFESRRGEILNLFYKKLKNVSCEYDRLNGWNLTSQAARYIRHVRWTCLFYISFIIWFLWTKPTMWLLILRVLICKNEKGPTA